MRKVFVEREGSWGELHERMLQDRPYRGKRRTSRADHADLLINVGCQIIDDGEWTGDLSIAKLVGAYNEDPDMESTITPSSVYDRVWSTREQMVLDIVAESVCRTSSRVNEAMSSTATIASIDDLVAQAMMPTPVMRSFKHAWMAMEKNQAVNAGYSAERAIQELAIQTALDHMSQGFHHMRVAEGIGSPLESERVEVATRLLVAHVPANENQIKPDDYRLGPVVANAITGLVFNGV